MLMVTYFIYLFSIHTGSIPHKQGSEIFTEKPWHHNFSLCGHFKGFLRIASDHFDMKHPSLSADATLVNTHIKIAPKDFGWELKGCLGFLHPPILS